MPNNLVGLRSGYFLDIEADGSYSRYAGIAKSIGTDSALRLIRTGADGRIDSSLVPENLEPADSIEAIEAIPAGSYVHIYYDALGKKRMIKLATSQYDPNATKPELAGPFPANGFVLESYNKGDQALVFTRGVNSRALVTGSLEMNIGEKVTLYRDGGAMHWAFAWPYFSAGDVCQILGNLLDVTPTASRVVFQPLAPVILSTVRS